MQMGPGWLVPACYSLCTAGRVEHITRALPTTQTATKKLIITLFTSGSCLLLCIKDSVYFPLNDDKREGTVEGESLCV